MAVHLYFLRRTLDHNRLWHYHLVRNQVINILWRPLASYKLVELFVQYPLQSILIILKLLKKKINIFFTLRKVQITLSFISPLIMKMNKAIKLMRRKLSLIIVKKVLLSNSLFILFYLNKILKETIERIILILN